MCIRIKQILCMVVSLSAMLLTLPATAAEPIQVGVIAIKSAINGRAIFQATQLAADEINANGGIDGRQLKLTGYDTHGSATESVRAFQRLVHQDHVVTVIGSYISEAALAVQPWSARLKMPYLIPGAATTKISQRVHDDYDNYKYTFMLNLNSAELAQVICNQSHDLLAEQLGYTKVAIMSGDFAWTQPFDKELEKCLPKAGLQVTTHIRVAGDTADYSPVFHKIVDSGAQAIVGGLAHIGVKPTIQWHQNQIPVLFAGWSSQAGSDSFWKDTNGAAQGEITGNLGAPTAAVTDKSVPFAKAYIKRFGESPAYAAYDAYDAVYILKNAIEHAGSTDADALVKALEKTDYTGTMGREMFYPKESPWAHGLKVGKDFVPGVGIQWQDGKAVVIWPKQAANGKLIVPDFVPTVK